METRARYALIGLFMLAVILASFGFVYWLENKGGFAERKTYQVRFQGSVSGLLIGSAVLFNGIRVGEVTNSDAERRRARPGDRHHRRRPQYPHHERHRSRPRDARPDRRRGRDAARRDGRLAAARPMAERMPDAD